MSSNNVYHVAWSRDGKSFVRFCAAEATRNGPQVRYTDCRVFDGSAARPIPARTVTEGKDVCFAYLEPAPSWWNQREPDAPSAS